MAKLPELWGGNSRLARAPSVPHESIQIGGMSGIRDYGAYVNDHDQHGALSDEVGVDGHDDRGVELLPDRPAGNQQDRFRSWLGRTD